MMTEEDDPMVLESVLAARAREIKEAVLETRVFENSIVDSPASGAMEVAHQVFVRRTQPTGLCVQVRTLSEMMTEMDDPMVLESVLAAHAREKKEASLENGVFENSIGDSPASGAAEVADQVVEMETSPPAPIHRPLGDNMSKHGDGAQSEAAQEEDLFLPTKPSEGGIASEPPFESSSFPSPNSGILNDLAGEGTAVAQEKRRSRGKNWAKEDTDDLLRAVSNTKKGCTRMEQGTDNDSYWDAVAKGVRGRTGHECRGRMDTLKRSFSKLKDEQGKEFQLLSEKDFAKMKVSPLTEEWYNQIRDYCPPRPKKKLKMNGAGSSSKSTGFVPDISTLGLQQPVFPDGIDQGKSVLVDPPASQLERHQVVDPLHQAPPASPPRSDDREELPEASSPELPVADRLQLQAPPAAPPHWSDLIEDFPATPIEPAISAPLLRYDFLEDLDDISWLDSNKF